MAFKPPEGLPKVSQLTKVLSTPEIQFEKMIKGATKLELPTGPLSVLLKLQQGLETGEPPELPEAPKLEGILAKLPKLPELPALAGPLGGGSEKEGGSEEEGGREMVKRGELEGPGPLRKVNGKRIVLEGI